jgi:hypothetical protein
MDILKKWINPIYLDPKYIEVLKETVKAKPEIKYLVLDNFFNQEVLDELIKVHETLNFTEAFDRILPNGTVLPYDGAVNFATPNHFGADLFYSEEWHDYTTNLVNLEIKKPRGTDIKLRRHDDDAQGFWLHTDSTTGPNGRDIVIIGYFNKGWETKDGGLLQLWREEEIEAPNTKKFSWKDMTNVRMDFLAENIRLNIEGPGSGYTGTRDLLLVDQIVPVYNRVFICNFKANPTYHSITPSNGKIRQNFVQWIFNKK